MTTTPHTETNPDRYRRLARTLDERVRAVPAERWDAPSPCEGWSARDVLGHVIETERQFLAGQGGIDLPAGPDVAVDPVAAWQHTSSAIQAVLDDPAQGGKEYEGVFGRTTIADSLATFYAFDLVIHGWDIAKATGTDERIPAQDLALVKGFTDALGDNVRRDGVCGPAIEPPARADEQTRLLAYLGRKSWD
ncbi:TIGR03086 family metal-binding protein [Aldersonia sp. NBC_00410]|uniref:TIGR03086 family metal-binding protein n=1 Tax=Aldersonia sp. NBC_00410 TaxID=2975954 RepID=UPI00224C858B|nr:TIGR03086 family metal-binding protein [Aldersonia sp. NBC_00410]MCX5043572.1 TIGR03086 family metal-binding protein [Aldersonia sp. NBC_00410]